MQSKNKLSIFFLITVGASSLGWAETGKICFEAKGAQYSAYVTLNGGEKKLVTEGKSKPEVWQVDDSKSNTFVVTSKNNKKWNISLEVGKRIYLGDKIQLSGKGNPPAYTPYSNECR